MTKLVLMAYFLFALSIPAQQLSQLGGVVTDPTGALVDGASIRLESESRDTLLREATTHSDGRYIFPQILPGRYRIIARAQGLRDVRIQNVVVQVNTPATVNIAFEALGSVADSVTVTADVSNLNTVDASLGNAIGSQPILQLPSFARNVTQLLALQPGVNEFGNVNGGKSDQANVTLDGIDVNEQQERTSFTSVLRVTLDSVEEFRTTTSNANAEQGRSSGAQVSLVTKSGKNDTHGSAYWYHRNTATAANGFFNNQAGLPRQKLLINIPGVSLGGPIRKSKLFYFVNWEQRSDRSESAEDRIVPSAELRQGIVKYPSAGTIATLGADRVRQIDPRGLGANSAVLDLFKTYPLPNNTTEGDGLNFLGYRFTAPLRLRYNTYIARIDYQLNPNHNFFLRGQLQNDRSTDPPQFPGDQPNSVRLANAKGLAFGYNAVLTSRLVSTFRYGITRYSRESTGIQTASAVSFRGLDDRYGLTTGIARTMPVHMFSEDMSWTNGRHTLQFGAVARLVGNRSRNSVRSFHSAVTNSSWLRGVARDFTAPGLAAADRTAFADAMVAVLGIVSEVDANYNYLTSGSVLPVGAPIRRNYRNEEYELHVQDSWHATKRLTFTYGLRWSLMPPIYEADGQQVSTNIPLGDWFNTRGSLADQGLSQEGAGRIVFLTRDDPKGRPIYPFHKKNFAPRFAVAYAPASASGWKRKLFGEGNRTTVRAGWGMFYDIVGQPLARTFDLSGFGLATTLVNPSGQLTASTAPRFTGLYSVPPDLIRPAPKGGFPVTFPDNQDEGFAITNSIDDKLKIPYTMNMNFTIGREFGNGWFVQGSYVGRLSRNSLINRDLAMPTNLRDPASGQSYFEAASQLALLVNRNVPIAGVQPIPFWENMFGPLRTNTRSATQQAYNVFRGYPNDYVTALGDLDEYCSPCSRLGANSMLNPQFSSLSAWSSIAGGNYHSMQWSLRKRFSNGLTMDFNYTYSKSQDLSSAEENSGSFAGFLVNSWDPSQRRGVSDYDQRHVWNMWWVYELPFGKGKRMLPDLNPLANALLGGWQFSGVWTQSTELPWSVGNGRNWPTNWNVTTFGTPIGAVTQSTKTKAGGGPKVWANPAAALAEWQYTLPGQSGSRNTIRIDGRSNFDFSLAKRFAMPYREGHSVQFRWETFNVFNQVRFGDPDLGRSSSTNFGKYTSQANDPRQMQFALRYEF